MRFSLSCRVTETGEEKCLVIFNGKVVPPAIEVSRDEAQALVDKENSKLLRKLIDESRSRKEEKMERYELCEEYEALQVSIKAHNRSGGR